MGQKVGGYRRNVPYGQETSLLSNHQEGKRELGWLFQVNPKRRVGWDRGTSGIKEREYGDHLSDGRRLRRELEEVRWASGGESNGFGRKGTKHTGYAVYGEYTREVRKDVRGGKRVRGLGKVRTATELFVAMERIVINYEKKRNVKVERKRTNLKERRKSEGLEADKEERRSVIGYSSKRRKGEERCEAIALSGVISTTKRRTNLVVRELEGGLNHMEVLRNRESLRTHHAKSSQYGRKRLGLDESKGSKGGYYGLNVTVKGPLEGARRTMAYVVQLGTVPRGTKRARIMATHEHAKTKVGTIGVRVTYCYGRG